MSTVPLPHPNGSASGSASVQLVDCLRIVCMQFCKEFMRSLSFFVVEHIQRTNFCSLLRRQFVLNV